MNQLNENEFGARMRTVLDQSILGLDTKVVSRLQNSRTLAIQSQKQIIVKNGNTILLSGNKNQFILMLIFTIVFSIFVSSNDSFSSFSSYDHSFVSNQADEDIDGDFVDWLDNFNDEN